MRCPTILVALAAVLGLAAQPTPVGAQSTGSTTTPYYMQGYTLTIPAGGLPAADPNATSPELVFPNTPAGAIVAPPDGANPMTFLPDSIGYTPSGSTSASPYVIVDLLKNDGSAFGLSFFNTGLVSGNLFHVDLDINTALQSNPPAFVSNLPGVSLIPDATTPIVSGGTTATTTPTATDNPEPLSLLLWSALTGIGLWYARHLRPAPAPAS